MELNSNLYLGWVLNGRVADFCFVWVKYPGTRQFSAPSPRVIRFLPLPLPEKQWVFLESCLLPPPSTPPQQLKVLALYKQNLGKCTRFFVSSPLATSHHLQPTVMNVSLSGDPPSCSREHSVEIYKWELAHECDFQLQSLCFAYFFPSVQIIIY